MIRIFLSKREKIFIVVVCAVALAIAFSVFITKNSSYATASNETSEEDNSVASSSIKSISPVLQQNSRNIDLDKIIDNNEKTILTEKIVKQEQDLEFNTQYKENASLAKGKMQTIQEGKDGKQNSVVKQVYKEGQLVSETQISSSVTKASIDKIVEIGTGNYSSSYVPIVGDSLKVSPTTLSVRIEPNSDAKVLITLNKNDTVTLKSSKDDWYYISYESYEGWAPKDSLYYYKDTQSLDGDSGTIQYSKDQLTQGFGISMLLNRKSGLSLEQYRKIFDNDPNDKNKIFQNNADYFYYAEQQYNVNGLFVAAVGIHESAWGTSQIAMSKKNLFGYGAFDRDPGGMALSFDDYSAEIDLMFRVFSKYYLNPAGTPIYGDEIAQGTYYRGSTVSSVNECYASDPNWANGVFKWMTYLYNRL